MGQPDDYEDRQAKFGLSSKKAVEEAAHQSERVFLDLRPEYALETEPLSTKVVSCPINPGSDPDEVLKREATNLLPDKAVPILAFSMDGGKTAAVAKAALLELGYTNVLNAGG